MKNCPLENDVKCKKNRTPFFFYQSNQPNTQTKIINLLKKITSPTTLVSILIKLNSPHFIEALLSHLHIQDQIYLICKFDAERAITLAIEHKNQPKNKAHQSLAHKNSNPDSSGLENSSKYSQNQSQSQSHLSTNSRENSTYSDSGHETMNFGVSKTISNVIGDGYITGATRTASSITKTLVKNIPKSFGSNLNSTSVIEKSSFILNDWISLHENIMDHLKLQGHVNISEKILPFRLAFDIVEA